MFFIALAAQVFFIEGYYKNKNLNPIFVSSLTIAVSFFIIAIVIFINQTFSTFSTIEKGDIISASEFYSGSSTPRILSYLSAIGYGTLFSGISVLCFFIYSYYTMKLNKDVRKITDINFGFQKGIENIISKLKAK